MPVVRYSDIERKGCTLSAKKLLAPEGKKVRIRRMEYGRFLSIINGWARRMGGWTISEVARQLAHPGPIVGGFDRRLRF